MSERVYRDLVCTGCQQLDGWTLKDIKTDHRYWCNTCGTFVKHEYVGEPYARDNKMKRIEQVLEFEETKA